MISCSAFSETIANELTTSLNIQKMIAKNRDNESGIPSQMLKSTGIVSDQDPNTINK
jgi:hypothetical protein